MKSHFTKLPEQLAIGLLVASLAIAGETPTITEIPKLPLEERAQWAIAFDRENPKRWGAAWNSITTEELPQLAAMLQEGEHKHNRLFFGLLSRQMRRFDAEDKEYDRNTCIDALLDTMEAEKDEIGYHLLLRDVRNLKDSRLIIYVKERDNLTHPGAIRTRTEMLENWNKHLQERPHGSSRIESGTTARRTANTTDNMIGQMDPTDKIRWIFPSVMALLVLAAALWRFIATRRVTQS